MISNAVVQESDMHISMILTAKKEFCTHMKKKIKKLKIRDSKTEVLFYQSHLLSHKLAKLQQNHQYLICYEENIVSQDMNYQNTELLFYISFADFQNSITLDPFGTCKKRSATLNIADLCIKTDSRNPKSWWSKLW